jgi:hypothetical protein
MLKETEIEDDTLGLKKALRAGAIGASKLADKLGFTQEEEYKGKTKEEIQMKNGLKDVDAEENPGLSKLPENVRNKMGYKRSGGKVSYKSGGKVSSASKRADGCAQRGKTKGRIV